MAVLHRVKESFGVPDGNLKGELNPKIKFVLFERTLKITE